MKKKRCVLCDFEFEYDDKVNESVFVRPYGEGAEYYHDLWHFHVDKCPNCGYAEARLVKGDVATSPCPKCGHSPLYRVK